MKAADVARKAGTSETEHKLSSLGATALRLALVTNLLWAGALKFEEYEAENIEPMISTSPLFSWLYERLGTRKTARLIGVTEITLGSLIAAKPLAPRASAVGSLGTIAMFSTTLSFLLTTPGVWQEGYGRPRLSLVGHFLVKDSVFLGASMLTTAESLRDARRG
jgi:uncharacterized membrane protein YkgB